MTNLLIPEDKLLDAPDETLFKAADKILQLLNINFEDKTISYTDEELNSRYDELLRIVNSK